MAAHAGTAAAVVVDPFADCVQQVNNDLITEYGDLSLAAADMGMTLAELNQSVSDTCTEEVAGATAATTARQDAGTTTVTVDPTAPVVQAIDETVLPDTTPKGTVTDSSTTSTGIVTGVVEPTTTPAPVTSSQTGGTTSQTGTASSTPTPTVTTGTGANARAITAITRNQARSGRAIASHALSVLKAKALKAHGHGRSGR